MFGATFLRLMFMERRKIIDLFFWFCLGNEKRVEISTKWFEKVG